MADAKPKPSVLPEVWRAVGGLTPSGRSPSSLSPLSLAEEALSATNVQMGRGSLGLAPKARGLRDGGGGAPSQTRARRGRLTRRLRPLPASGTPVAPVLRGPAPDRPGVPSCPAPSGPRRRALGAQTVPGSRRSARGPTLPEPGPPQPWPCAVSDPARSHRSRCRRCRRAVPHRPAPGLSAGGARPALPSQPGLARLLGTRGRSGGTAAGRRSWVAGRLSGARPAAAPQLALCGHRAHPGNGSGLDVPPARRRRSAPPAGPGGHFRPGGARAAPEGCFLAYPPRLS